MSRRVAFVMNAATSPRTGLLKYGCRDTETIFRTLTDPRLGYCDPHISRAVTNCAGYVRFHAAFVKGILKNWSPADQLIFYFSGHGQLQNGLFSLLLGPESVEALPFDNLLNLLRQHGVHRSILILDACHSGAATSKAFDDSQFTDQLQNIPPGSAIIASCEQWELSKEHDPERLSLFTFLLETAIRCGLPEEVDREWLSLEDLLQQVEHRLQGPGLAHIHQTPRRKITDAGACLPFVKNACFSQSLPTVFPAPATQFMEVCWSQPILKTPLEQSVVGQLRPHMHTLRRLAWKSLQLLRKRHQPLLREIRVNLFLPHLDHSAGGGLELRLEPGLHCGMKSVQELEVTFSPGQGTAGTAFQTLQPVLSLRKSSRKQDHSQRLSLTGAQLRLLHPQIRWILSIPVIDPGSGTALAIVNLDGLRQTFTAAEIESLLPQLQPPLANLSTSLAALPRIHVHLGWSD